MTNVDELAVEMEQSELIRRQLAADLVRLRRLEATCRRYRRRLPAQVQNALDLTVITTRHAPPEADSMPGLFGSEDDSCSPA